MKLGDRLLCVCLAIAMVAVFVLIPNPASAQAVASLTGVVTDQTGAVVSGALVTLIDTKTNQTYTAETNESGAYTFTKLLPGPAFKLSISKQGFRASNVDNIYLGVDTTHTQNVQLVVGQSSETVEVNGSGSQVSLDTTDTSVSTTLDMGMVHELPLPIRDNPLGLLVYAPGVTWHRVGTTIRWAAAMEPWLALAETRATTRWMAWTPMTSAPDRHSQ